MVEKCVSDKDLKLLAYKILPEIKKFFADEKIQKEFQEWLKNKDSDDCNKKLGIDK
jgi:hypothetical protein